MLFILATSAAQPPFGTVVFQESRSQQSQAIQIATGSRYSHVGIVWDDGQVLEAVQPVRLTPFDTWVARGVDGHYVARSPALSDGQEEAMRAAAKPMLGRPYDAAFAWDDEALYCSELVVKVFAAAGVTLGEHRAIEDFPLEHPEVREKLRERGLPLDRLVVSPASILDDPDLKPED